MLMRRLATFVALLLMLSAAAPMLACVTDQAMTPQESACCRAMHGDCGDMAKMGCCVKKIATDEHPQLATSAPAIHLRWVVLAFFAPLAVSEPELMFVSANVPPQHSPPGLVIVRTTNLRI